MSYAERGMREPEPGKKKAQYKINEGEGELE
jgi:hypothetical protein